MDRESIGEADAFPMVLDDMSIASAVYRTNPQMKAAVDAIHLIAKGAYVEQLDREILATLLELTPIGRPLGKIYSAPFDVLLEVNEHGIFAVRKNVQRDCYESAGSYQPFGQIDTERKWSNMVREARHQAIEHGMRRPTPGIRLQ